VEVEFDQVHRGQVVGSDPHEFEQHQGGPNQVAPHEDLAQLVQLRLDHVEVQFVALHHHRNQLHSVQEMRLIPHSLAFFLFLFLFFLIRALEPAALQLQEPDLVLVEDQHLESFSVLVVLAELLAQERDLVLQVVFEQVVHTVLDLLEVPVEHEGLVHNVLGEQIVQVVEQLVVVALVVLLEHHVKGLQFVRTLADRLDH